MSFGFVYLHPFTDGNGRLHRFLVHAVLARTGFTPPGLIVPVSAAILRDPTGYDAALEAFSRPVMQCLDYTLDPEGRIEIHGDTAWLYRYPDLTEQIRRLYGWLALAIDHDLIEELDLLARFDAARARMRAIVQMPDRLEHLFLRLCKQNGWRLSVGKRRQHFPTLSDEEVDALEAAVRAAMAE